MNIKTISSVGYNLWAEYVEGEDTPFPVCAPEMTGHEMFKLDVVGHEIDTDES